jgi:metal-responsive CopG/Arc/MetJ family transcriptional regulator
MTKRVRVSITLPKECIDYVEKYVKDRTFKDRSHALERIILKFIEEEKEERK